MPTRFIFENSTDTCNPWKTKTVEQLGLINDHRALASRVQLQWESWLAFQYAYWRKEPTSSGYSATSRNIERMPEKVILLGQNFYIKLLEGDVPLSKIDRAIREQKGFPATDFESPADTYSQLLHANASRGWSPPK